MGNDQKSSLVRGLFFLFNIFIEKVAKQDF